MKKMISMAIAVMVMVLGMSTLARAAEEAYQLQQTVTVGDKTYAAGTKGSKIINGYTYKTPITVNGTTYPAGHQFQVMQTMSGEFVPVASGNAVAVAGAGAAKAATGAMATTTAAGAAVIATVAVLTKKDSTNYITATATTP